MKEKNLYRLLNNFCEEFGHKGRYIINDVDNNAIYVKIQFDDLLTNKDEIKKDQVWAMGYCFVEKNSCMCKIFVDQKTTNTRPTFRFSRHSIISNDNSLYVNSYLMPDYNIAKQWSAALETYSKNSVYETNVYISNKMLHTFIQNCEQNIEKYKNMITLEKLDDIETYAKHLTETIKMYRLLKLEEQYRMNSKN